MNPTEFTPSCPVPLDDYSCITMAHGGGGRLMQQLIDKMFVPALGGRLLDELHDGAVFDVGAGRLAFTTDSFVVRPLFFPGGDIGSLAIHGTVNDLAMCGAKPLYLSVAFIIEEGLPMETLWRVAQSMRQAADATEVELVTGDTKVVDRGKGDGIFINTAGIGVVAPNVDIGPGKVRANDVILVNGDLGRHGVAIMAVREGLAFESTIESDSAPLSDLVQTLLRDGVNIHCMRDCTRGGLASVLVEIAETSNMPIHIDARSIPVREDVRGACEILGLDPLYVANEGRCALFVAPRDAERALAIMHAHPLGQGACCVGSVSGNTPGVVTLKSSIGSHRIIELLSGEQLPRIC
jgi:hydrogenase expression/formation protein HypE